MLLIRQYNGKLRCLSWAMKRLRAVKQPVTRCTPFKFWIGHVLVMSEIFSISPEDALRHDKAKEHTPC
jgi:hypothetical protein